MKKIRVVHIVTLLELGGAQQNTLFTVRGLDRSRFEVFLICGQDAFLDEEARKIPGLSLHFLPNLVRPVNPWRDLLCLFQMARLLKEISPDIVHTHSSKAGILGRLAARLAGVPVIIHSIHGFGFNPYQKFFVRALFVWLERRIARLTRILIAVSQDNIETGLSLSIGRRDQYRLIRSGVDIQKIRQTAEATDAAALRRELAIPPEKKVVLTVGPFKVQKNPLGFLDLAKALLSRAPDALFLMAGDGELRPAVEKRIRELDLAAQVRLLGWRRDVPRLLKICDLFVMTSLWEGLPRAAVEALIVGKPVFAFAADGLRDIVREGENGFLSYDNSPENLAGRVSEALRDAAMLERLSAGARASIGEEFDIHGMVRRQEELYSGLIDKTAPELIE